MKKSFSISICGVALLWAGTLFSQEQNWSSPHGLPSTPNNCKNCHTSAPNLRLQSGLNLVPEDALFWDFGFSPHMRDGIQLGNYAVANLSDPILRSHLRLGEKPALIVKKAGEEAEKSTLKTGDVLLQLDDQDVSDVVQLQSQVDETQDDQFTFHGIRDGKPATFVVSTAELMSPERAWRIGVHAESPSAALSSQLDLFQGEGLLITGLVDDAPAQKAGLKVHDILLRVNGHRLSGLDDLRVAVQETRGQSFELHFLRAGKENKLEIAAHRELKVASSTQTGVCPGLVPTFTPIKSDINFMDLYFSTGVRPIGSKPELPSNSDDN